ncbi:MAG: hypothetical protein WCG25_09655 [bacterium]
MFINIVHLIFQFTCTARVTSSETRYFSWYVGRLAFVNIEYLFQICSRNSSVVCGANGETRITNVSKVFLSIFSNSVR